MIITPSSHLLLLSTTTVVTIPFSPSSTETTTTNLHEILSHLASTSIAIALRLNSSQPISNHSSSSVYTASLVQTPLSHRSYDGYSISLTSVLRLNPPSSSWTPKTPSSGSHAPLTTSAPAATSPT
ncbi:hypothetical protein LINPERHAP1_LOCUS23098 [Linum perenne]